MAAPPPPAQFQKQDFPSSGLGSQEALETFFTQLNAHTQGTHNALSNGLTLGDNANAEFKTLTIKTPTTDWVTLTPTNSWVAFGAPYSTPAYRVGADGRVYLKGFIKSGTNSTNLFTQTLPPPSEKTPLPTVSNGGAADIACHLTVFQDGTVQLPVGSNTYLCLDGLSYQPASYAPGVLSCFPQSVSTKITTPKAVLLAGCTDTSGTPIPPALGHLSYTNTGSGAFSLTNLPGLIPGRTYTVTLLILGG